MIFIYHTIHISPQGQWVIFLDNHWHHYYWALHWSHSHLLFHKSKDDPESKMIINNLYITEASNLDYYQVLLLKINLFDTNQRFNLFKHKTLVVIWQPLIVIYFLTGLLHQWPYFNWLIWINKVQKKLSFVSLGIDLSQAMKIRKLSSKRAVQNC